MGTLRPGVVKIWPDFDCAWADASLDVGRFRQNWGHPRRSAARRCDRMQDRYIFLGADGLIACVADACAMNTNPEREIAHHELGGFAAIGWTSFGMPWGSPVLGARRRLNGGSPKSAPKGGSELRSEARSWAKCGAAADVRETTPILRAPSRPATLNIGFFANIGTGCIALRARASPGRPIRNDSPNVARESRVILSKRIVMGIAYCNYAAIMHLQRSIPSKRESSPRADYVCALCAYAPPVAPTGLVIRWLIWGPQRFSAPETCIGKFGEPSLKEVLVVTRLP